VWPLGCYAGGRPPSPSASFKSSQPALATPATLWNEFLDNWHSCGQRFIEPILVGGRQDDASRLHGVGVTLSRCIRQRTGVFREFFLTVRWMGEFGCPLLRIFWLSAN
jgi:hypothetical protein